MPKTATFKTLRTNYPSQSRTYLARKVSPRPSNPKQKHKHKVAKHISKTTMKGKE